MTNPCVSYIVTVLALLGLIGFELKDQFRNLYDITFSNVNGIGIDEEEKNTTAGLVKTYQY